MADGEMMFNVSFVDDPLSRRVTRLLLLVQVLAMLIVVGLSIAHQFFLAFAISFVTLLVLTITLLWLYARYRDLPIIREKRELERLTAKFRKGVQTEQKNIQVAVNERARLFEAEKAEISTALEALQKKHFESGLRMASLHEAAISGIGPKLKEQLAGHNILSAADISSEQRTAVPGLGKDEYQALMDWRHSVLDELKTTQPNELPPARLEAIQQKVQKLQAQNSAVDRRARASKQMLEYELLSFRERLKQLALFTFPRYLSRSLTSRSILAAPLALALILTQVISSVSATAGSFIAWIPAMMPLAASTTTDVPTKSATGIISHLPTAPATATETIAAPKTSTFTATSAPTNTLASTSTQPPPLAATYTPFAAFTLLPSNTALIPVSGGGNTGNCDPSYPGVCIPPAPPDLDCKDVPYKRFQVLAPDPHSFDRDGDGIGCES